MKYILTTLALLTISLAYTQQTINTSIQHDGLTRTYILYVPASYSASNPAPLVFNFHGYTSNNTEQMGYGDFRPIADTAGFLIVHPMGTLDPNTSQPYWNANWGGTVDDIGFTEALIDSIAAEYSINEDRIYSTGMSNGGFMSYTLACELSNKFAAIASVTGTMNVNQNNTCNAQHPTPVMEIHGTSDPTVPYNGNTTMMPTDSVFNYWVDFNNCTGPLLNTQIADINLFDGSTVTHLLYKGGDNGVEVELYKINNGGHTWPGAYFGFANTNYDIDASLKIWEFFAKYDINGKILSPVSVKSLNDIKVIVYPNPATELITINNLQFVNQVIIYNLLGEEVKRRTVNNTSISLSVSDLKSGIYFIKSLSLYNDITISKFVIK